MSLFVELCVCVFVEGEMVLVSFQNCLCNSNGFSRGISMGGVDSYSSVSPTSFILASTHVGLKLLCHQPYSMNIYTLLRV